MDNSSSGMIELSQVTTSRGQFPVLSRFTLTISQGQFINLYGPTGCGKTTVLRADLRSRGSGLRNRAGCRTGPQHTVLRGPEAAAPQFRSLHTDSTPF